MESVREVVIWPDREPSIRRVEDESLKQRIRELHIRSKKCYGYRPIYGHLQDTSN